MPIESLPEGLVDYIFTFFEFQTLDNCSFPSSFSYCLIGAKRLTQCECAALSLAAFRNVCLLSKTLLGPARRALYRQPFRMLTGTEEAFSNRAVKLLESLSKDGGRLGQLVHSLEGIHSEILRWEAELNPKRWTWGFVKDNNGEPQIVEWYLGILKTCPQLQSVEIVGTSKSLLVD